MIRVEGRVTIREEAARAFVYLADFRNLPRWDPGIVDVKQLEGDVPAKGASYHVVARFLGVHVPMRYRTTFFDPEACVAEIRGETPPLLAIDRITVRPAGTGADVHWVADFSMKGPMRLAERAMQPLFERLGRRAMDGLRATLG